MNKTGSSGVKEQGVFLSGLLKELHKYCHCSSCLLTSCWVKKLYRSLEANCGNLLEFVNMVTNGCKLNGNKCDYHVSNNVYIPQ